MPTFDITSFCVTRDDQHLLLERLAQLGERHALLLQRRLEGLVGVELVLLADVADDAVELLVGELVAQLLARWVSSISSIASATISGVTSSIAFFNAASSAGWRSFGAHGLHLPLLEVGLGEDLAVHLHEDLLR